MGDVSGIVLRLGSCAAALMLVGCGDGDTPAAVEEEPTSVETPADEQAEGSGLPSSSLTTTDTSLRSDVSVEAAQLLSELEAETTDAGTVVEFDADVLFEFGSAALTEAATPVIATAVELLEATDDIPVLVRGHTDGIGGDEVNGPLSVARATAVRDALIDGGIDPGRLDIEGVGASEPVVAETLPDGSDDPDARARNRRVELTFPTLTSP